MTDLLSEALQYAERGWYVFPCRESPGIPYEKDGIMVTPKEKTPYISGGLNNATTDPDQITAWWTTWPNAMIGVNAGKSGLFVVDIDKKHVNGLDTYTSWDVSDVSGLHSFTPSGGIHVVFTGSGKTSTNGKTGVDTRGEGGYFIAPPSRIIEGEYPGDYKTFDDWSRTPGIIPDGLMSKLFPDKTYEYVRGKGEDGEKKHLSRATLQFLANGAPKGERNSSLFKALADFAGCGYTREEARDATHGVSVRIGLPEEEYEHVLEQAYSKPRTSSIPDSIQEKINQGKNAAGLITGEEQIIMEEALLACLLIDNSLIPIVNDILGYNDFHALKNRVIYKAISKIYNNELRVDYITVSNEVEKETRKIKLDDLFRLSTKYLLDTESVVTYANIIREKASIRKLSTIMDNKGKYLNSGNLSSILNSLEKDIADVALYGGVRTTGILDSKQATAMVIEQTDKMSSGEIEQVKTGFLDYDYHIGGLYSNELVICAGRAGDGKSSLALTLINEVGIRQNKKVAFFTLEMSNHECISRLICQMTGIPFKDVYKGNLTEEEWVVYREAMAKISNSGIYFDDSFGMTVRELRAKIRKLMEQDIKLVVVDQLEQIQGYDSLPTYIQYDKIAYDIKSMTKEFNVPIILNHQLNRGITDRKLKNPEPQLSDLNQAGEKPANQVWVIHHKKDEKTGKILKSKIKVLKNRNGPRIEFSVIYIGERMLFANPTREQDKEPWHEGDNEYDDYEQQGHFDSVQSYTKR